VRGCGGRGAFGVGFALPLPPNVGPLFAAQALEGEGERVELRAPGARLLRLTRWMRSPLGSARATGDIRGEVEKSFRGGWMTWVDLVVLGVVAVSGLLALARGFVREVLGISAWVGATAFTYWGLPLAKPQFAHWISSPEWLAPVTGAALFLGSLLVLMVVSGWIGGVVRGSRLGGVDRTLGLVFGLARGALLVVFAYIAVGMVIPIDQWPEVVQKARTLPVAYEGAVWLVALLPPGAKPHVSPPPVGHQTTAEELFRAQPLGRAVGPSTATQGSPGQISPSQMSPSQMSPSQMSPSQTSPALTPPRLQTRN